MADRPAGVPETDVTGKDATLSVGNRDIRITNFEWDFSSETSTSEFNNRVEGFTGYTTQETTGSYEWDGEIERNVAFVLNQDGTPRYDIRFTYQTPYMIYRFNRVRLQGLSGSNPSDGKVDRTVDWRADIMRWSRA